MLLSHSLGEWQDQERDLKRSVTFSAKSEVQEEDSCGCRQNRERSEGEAPGKNRQLGEPPCTVLASEHQPSKRPYCNTQRRCPKPQDARDTLSQCVALMKDLGTRHSQQKQMQTCGDLGWCDLGELLNKISKTFCFPDILAYTTRDLVNHHISLKREQNADLGVFASDLQNGWCWRLGVSKALQGRDSAGRWHSFLPCARDHQRGKVMN